jgi:inorganic pyrophosphatase/exopolyphosphatase
VKIAEELKKIANIPNLEEISNKMFDEKSDL